MKFAVLALLGLVQTATVNIPNIEWDQTKIANATADFKAWADRDAANG